MRINKSILSILLLLLVLIQFKLNAQVQSHQNSVIEYLGRMAQKGKIELNDFIKPIDRKTIYQKLIELEDKKNELSQIEITELNFFLLGFVNFFKF